jgi:phosphate transport system substrate-binding protein
MTTRRAFILTLSATTLLAACGQRPVAQQATPATPASVTVRVSGSGGAMPAVQKLGEGYDALVPGVRLNYLSGTNSGGAIRGVIDGSLDIAVSNRQLSEIESREPVLSFPFARDAAAFAVHRSVPLPGLRGSEIRDLYSGTITNWREVGGPDAPVIVLDRDEDESLRKLALMPLMAGRPVVNGTVTLTSASDMANALDATPYAIGYSSLGLLNLRASKHVVPIALDEVIPGGASVASGAYPWSLTFFLVVRANAPGAARAFVEHAVASSSRVLGPYEYASI